MRRLPILIALLTLAGGVAEADERVTGTVLELTSDRLVVDTASGARTFSLQSPVAAEPGDRVDVLSRDHDGQEEGRDWGMDATLSGSYDSWEPEPEPETMPPLAVSVVVTSAQAALTPSDSLPPTPLPTLRPQPTARPEPEPLPAGAPQRSRAARLPAPLEPVVAPPPELVETASKNATGSIDERQFRDPDEVLPQTANLLPVLAIFLGLVLLGGAMLLRRANG